MKKQVLIIMIIAMFLITSFATVSNAASANVTLEASKSSVGQGDTFTVVYAIKCADGINGGTAKFEYDSDKLELVSESLNSKFTNLGEGTLNYEFMISSGSETEIDLITLSFKVKANASVGKATITAKELTVDPDSGDSLTIDNKTAEITITEASAEPPANNTTNNNGSQNNAGNKNVNTNKNTNTNTNKNTNKDNTSTTTKIPYTGAAKLIFPGIVLTIIAGVSYIAYKRNNI